MSFIIEKLIDNKETNPKISSLNKSFESSISSKKSQEYDIFLNSIYLKPKNKKEKDILSQDNSLLKDNIEDKNVKKMIIKMI